MDAAGVVLPAAVPGGRVAVMEVDTRGSELVSIVVPPSIDRCSSVIDRKEEADAIDIPESICGNIMPHTEFSKSTNQLSSFQCQDAVEEPKFGSRHPSPPSIPSIEGKQIRRRSGKMASSSSGCSKRSRTGQMEDLSINEAEANDIKEKSQMAKPRNVLNGKRGDRRNGKICVKSKYDYFSIKAGMVSFNSGGGGNNSLGICGLKSDAYDVSKHLDELTVKELLDSHHKSLSIAKDKGKKAANLNDNILNSVRKACSILQQQKPSKIQNSLEIDNNCNRDLLASPPHSNVNENDNEKSGIGSTDVFSHGKVSPKVLDFPLCQPKDILDRVGLAPPMDLDVLLVDAAKPVICSKDNLDARGKQISHRASLANADAMKLSTNRSACHGKWVKIENVTSLFEGGTGFLSELECLSYDPELVPVKSEKSLPSAIQAPPSTPASFPSMDIGASSSATCPRATQLPSEYGGNLKREEDDSPRSLAAAQTLCDIANLFPKQPLHQRMSWTSNPSNRAMKACKSKLNNKFGETYAKPKSSISSHNQVKTEALPSLKKPRLLINAKSKNLNTGANGLVNWSIPRSTSQSPSRSYRDAFANGGIYNSFVTPPPSTRVSDKAYKSRQRLR